MQCEYQMHNNNLSCQLLKKLNYIEQGEVSRQIWSEIRKTAESVICLGTTRVSGKNQEQSWQKQKKKTRFSESQKIKKKKTLGLVPILWGAGKLKERCLLALKMNIDDQTADNERENMLLTIIRTLLVHIV